MPRKPTKSPEEIYNLLKKLQFIDEYGAYYSYANEVWNDAVRALSGALSKDYIYLYITQDRNRVSSQIHGIDCAELKKKQVLKKSDEELNYSTHNLDLGLTEIRSSIHLNLKQWRDLEERITLYADNREYEVLEPGWTGRLYQSILDNYKLPCPFAFKNAKINRNEGECFLTIKGKCPECSNAIHLYAMNEPNAHGIDFHISTLDTREIIHKKKRQLRGTHREEVVKEVRAKTTRKWRLEQANKHMDFGDCEPGNLYSSIVLRKAKQQQIDKEIGTGPSKNPILDTINLKSNPEFACSIHEICYTKFYAMYWTPDQLAMYKKMMSECCGIICIDATGSIIQPLSTLDGSNSVIFLYQAVGVFKNKTLPLFQMISEKHDSNTLQYWIGEWLRSNLKAPRQVLTDFSLALLNACLVAFNQKNLKNYMSHCFEQASEQININFKMSILRIDIAHLLHFVSRWPVFKKDSPHVKDFFLKSLAILTQTKTISEFCMLCIQTLTVAKSQFVDLESSDDSCFAAQKHLLDIMKKGYIVPEKSNDLFADLSALNDFDEIDLPNNIAKLLSDIDKKSSSHSSGKFLNPYFCPDFAKRFLKFCTYFLIWTNIMPNTYYASDGAMLEEMSVASSARCEAYFKDLKTLILENMRSMRVDKVIIIHLRSLAGTAKLLCAWNDREKENLKPQPDPQINFHPPFSSTLDTFCLTSEKTENSISTEVKSKRKNRSPLMSLEGSNSYLNKVDSWKGLLKKKQERGFHFKPCPDIENKHNRPKKQRNMPLLLNGNGCLPVHTKNGKIKIKNTCAFDSFIHCIRAGALEWVKYHDYITSSHHDVFQFVNLFLKFGPVKKVYEKRGELLLKSLNFKGVDDKILDCVCNVGVLIQTIMTNEPSVREVVVCDSCMVENINVREILSPDMSPMYKQGLAGLQNSLKLYEKEKFLKKCMQCSTIKTIKKTGGEHLIIDIEALQWDIIALRSNHNEPYQKAFSLNEVPKEIKFCGNTYKIAGVIAYIPGHYTSYVRCISGRWERQDGITIKSKSLKASQTIKIKIHILFYVKT